MIENHWHGLALAINNWGFSLGIRRLAWLYVSLRKRRGRKGVISGSFEMESRKPATTPKVALKD